MMDDYPNIKQAITLLVVLSILKFTVLFGLSSANIGLDSSQPLTHILTIILASSGIIFYALQKSARSRASLHKHFTIQKESITSSFDLLLAIIIIVIGLHLLLSNYLNIYYYFQYGTLYTPPSHLNAPINFLSALLVCFVAPLFEELIFRGLILRGLLHFHSKHIAIFLSAVLFSVVHLNVGQLLPTFLTGYFFAWLYVRGHSLWLPIIAHILFNTIAFLIENSGVPMKGVNYFPNNDLIFAHIGWQLAALAGLIGGIYYLSISLKSNGSR